MLLKPKDQKHRGSLKFEIIDHAYRVYPDGRQVCTDSERGRQEYRDRKHHMWMRQHGICTKCKLWIREGTETFDHDAGRGLGGAHRDDRIVLPDGEMINSAMHWGCNVQKGSKRNATS